MSGRAAAALLAVGLALAGPTAAATLDPGKALDQYSLQTWTLEQGLPNSTVTALAQTSDGYLWVATYEGLARFDGVRFTVFHNGTTPALASNSIRALAAGADGTLWIGTHGGGLVRLKDDRFTRFSAKDGLPSEMVLALHVDQGGVVWVGTTGGLARLDGERLEPVGPFRDSVSCILRDRLGFLWVGTHGAGLRRLSPRGEWESFGHEQGLPADVVSSLYEDGAGTLWVGTVGGGLSRRQGDRFAPFGTREGLPGTVVWGVLGDRRGTLWIATGGAGLVRLQEGRLESLAAPEGAAETVVYSLLEDREGSLWVGSNGSGLQRLRDGRFTTYTRREGLSHDFVYAVREDAAGVLWAGTSDGLNRMVDGRWQPQPGCGGLLHTVVRSLGVDPQGVLWVGTYGSGVCRLQDGKWTTFTRQDGLAHDGVRSVLVARDGALWAGTVGGLSRFHQGAWRTYTVADGLPVNSIIGLVEDAENVLWIGTDGGGIVRYREGRFERFGAAEGVPSSVVLALYSDGQGGIWAGTNAGLALFREGRFVTFTSRDGLPSDSVYQIVDDRRGGLWLGTSRGIARVERDSLFEHLRQPGQRLRLEVFDKGDGLKSVQCTAPALPAGWRARDGRLWFGTTRGVAVVDPADLGQGEQAAPVVIEEVVADERSLSGRQDLRLPPATSRLAFHYTAPALAAPNRVRFRYRLEGLDRDWIDAGERRTAYYSHLPPGRYRFAVSSGNAEGAWNEAVAAVGVEMLPHAWQTWWFTTLCALGVLGLVALAHRRRVSRLHVREALLQRLVDERTHSLSAAKESAEAATREAEHQRHLAEEADALKTELLGIAAHDLRNPLQLVSGLSELMSQGLASGPKVAELSHAVHDASRRMLEIVNSLLTTAALDRGLELRPSALNLAHLAADVLDEHGRKAASKGQRLLLEAEEDCRLLADYDRVRQVLDNLVSNAIKFSPQGGDVEVRVLGEEKAVRVEVRDHGPGLTAQDLEQAFHRFARLSARPTGDEPATGLGLSIVKGLVELHGGRVWAESEGAGHGAAFIVELPRTRL